MIILQKVKFLLVILLLELLFSASTYSQTYKAWMNAGDKAIATGNYAEAIEYFTKATDYEVEDARLYFQLGNAFRLYNDYNRAAFWYQKTYSIDDDNLLIVTSDRLSAFDVVLPDPIPGKGAVLTQLSNFWF